MERILRCETKTDTNPKRKRSSLITNLSTNSEVAVCRSRLGGRRSPSIAQETASVHVQEAIPMKSKAYRALEVKHLRWEWLGNQILRGLTGCQKRTWSKQLRQPRKLVADPGAAVDDINRILVEL